MGVVVPIPKMPPFPPVVVVAIVAFSIFAAAALPCTAGRPATAVDAAPKPLVKNLQPTQASPAAEDFVRARCDKCNEGYPQDLKVCYELLLPYAASINSSYNRAAIAAVTAMVSNLMAFVGKLDTTDTSNPMGECIQVVNETASGAKEALAKLGRLDAMGDDKVDKENPDIKDVMNWVGSVNDNFAAKCQDGVGYASAQEYLSSADGIVSCPRPYWDNSLPSPDGSGP